MRKVAPWVLERTADGQQAEFLVVLGEQADLSRAEYLPTREEKGRYVFETLLETVKHCSLGQVTEALFSVGGQYRRGM